MNPQKAIERIKSGLSVFDFYSIDRSDNTIIVITRHSDGTSFIYDIKNKTFEV